LDIVESVLAIAALQSQQVPLLSLSQLLHRGLHHFVDRGLIQTVAGKHMMGNRPTIHHDADHDLPVAGFAITAVAESPQLRRSGSFEEGGKSAAGRAFQFVQLQVPAEGQAVTRGTFQFHVDKKKLQAAEWRDGHYLLRSNLPAGYPCVLWARYVQLTQIESVFRSLKSELGIRPIYHQLEHRADAHILIAFLAYCLQITLKHRLLVHAPGLTPTAVLPRSK
jgi:hypothetical protein